MGVFCGTLTVGDLIARRFYFSGGYTNMDAEQMGAIMHIADIQALARRTLAEAGGDWDEANDGQVCREVLVEDWINPYQSYADAADILSMLGGNMLTEDEWHDTEMLLEELESAETAFCDALTQAVATANVTFRIGNCEGDGTTYALWMVVTREAN